MYEKPLEGFGVHLAGLAGGPQETFGSQIFAITVSGSENAFRGPENALWTAAGLDAHTSTAGLSSTRGMKSRRPQSWIRRDTGARERPYLDGGQLHAASIRYSRYSTSTRAAIRAHFPPRLGSDGYLTRLGCYSDAVSRIPLASDSDAIRML